MTIASIDTLIEDARNGRMFILVDDEDRENEGDLIIPGRFATPDAINFMAKEGRGLICLSMDGAMIDRLGLPLMAQSNGSRLGTAFTVSIEAREGVTTGISAADRARTIQVAINPSSGPTDIASPGHVFPLRAREGGVLVRAGHTEAAVDLAKLAGLEPAAVICEIMKDDGEMARLPDLIPFAEKHGLNIGTIADLIAWRRERENLVERVKEDNFSSEFGGEFRLFVYKDSVHGTEHFALTKGDISQKQPVPVRMHSLNILDDALGAPGGGVLKRSMEKLDALGKGAIVVLRNPLPVMPNSKDQASESLRHYGVGAQILADLGISEMILLTNAPKTVIGLDGFNLKITGYEPI